MNNIKTSKLLSIMLRIIFVLYSIAFLKQFFFRWDGYSYYMKFIDYLPDLSIIFIIWTAVWIVLAYILWITLFIIHKIISPFFKSIGLEHIIAWTTFTVIILTINERFLRIANTSLTFVLVSGFFIAVFVLIVHKNINSILNEIDIRIKPLVWLFVFALIVFVPFSIIGIMENKPYTGEYTHETGSSPSEKAPNFIVVVNDALTAENMQVYGHERNTTPFLSEWAKEAVVFNRAHSASTWTTASTMSLLTGQQVWKHKIIYFAENHPVKNHPNNLPKILRENGYHVYGYVQNPKASPYIFGMAENFLINDHQFTLKTVFKPDRKFINSIIIYYLNRPLVRDFLEQDRLFPAIYAKSLVKKILAMQKSVANFNFKKKQESAKNTGEATYKGNISPQNKKDPANNVALAPKTTRLAVKIPSATMTPQIVYNRFIDNYSEGKVKEPFFAYLHAYVPHDPYFPPRPYYGTYIEGGSIRYSMPVGEYLPQRQDEVEKISKRYDEFILYGDEQFKQFVQNMSDKIDMSNTIVIFTSDHGESFTGGYSGHTWEPLNEAISHIPLIFKMPDVKDKRVIDIPVGTIDIAPTILELAGIPSVKWMDGRSLVPFIEGQSKDPRPVFSSYLRGNSIFAEGFDRGAIALWYGDYKLLRRLDKNESLLFHLPSDPDLTKDISKQKPGMTQKLTEMIYEEMDRDF